MIPINLTPTRTHKVTNSYGVYDYFKYYRKNKPKGKEYILTETQYYNILRVLFTYLGQSLVSGKAIKLPFNLGSIELRKFSNKITIDPDTGKVITNMPIDWKSTLQLWKEDIDCYTNKQLVKYKNTETFKVIYNKRNTRFTNKSFLKFALNRNLKINLKENILKNKIDAFTFN